MENKKWYNLFTRDGLTNKIEITKRNIVMIVAIILVLLPSLMLVYKIYKPVSFAKNMEVIVVEGKERPELFQSWKDSVPSNHPLQGILKDESSKMWEMYSVSNQLATTSAKASAEGAKQNIVGNIIASLLEKEVKEYLKNYKVNVEGKPISELRLKKGDYLNFTFEKSGENIQIKYDAKSKKLFDINEFALTFTDDNRVLVQLME